MNLWLFKTNPDLNPAQKNPKLAVIDIAVQEELTKPVALSEIKAIQKLKSWELVRLSCLPQRYFETKIEL